MARVTWTGRDIDDVSRPAVRRERMSIDLRGHGPALKAIAQSMRVSVAALVRTILRNWLATRSVIDASHYGSKVSMSGKRLNPRKADLHRWRETFAEKLRGWGVEAEATRQATRGEGSRVENLWQLKAREDGRLKSSAAARRSGGSFQRSRMEALEAWTQIVTALRSSDKVGDHRLAQQISSFIRESDFAREHGRRNGRQMPERKPAREVVQLHSLLQPSTYLAQTQRPEPGAIPSSGIEQLAFNRPTSGGQFTGAIH